MSWRDRIGRLVGGTPKPQPKSSARKKTSIAVSDSPRAKAIAEARRIHRVQSAAIRSQIAKDIDALQRGGAKTLRDPEAIARLMGLLHAQRAMASLMRHDLRRYLVLTGLRQWLGEGTVPPATAPPKSRIVRR